ncbi:MAG TPA: SOS response-associated peptidase [Actinomycetaceae bacterium]|nr:SOS response-associated peptidase [Actinomycetaceae bacterium]
MCGRYASFRQAQELADIFEIDVVSPVAESLPPSWNVAPTQAARIVREEAPREELVRILDAGKWGLVPTWAKDESIGNRLINARSETITEKPSFRGPAIYSRCVVPVEGYYEWKAAPPGRRAKTPYFIHAADGGPIALAGLTTLWRDELRTFTIATRAASGDIAEIHDREPAMLRPEDVAEWLNPSQRDPHAVAAMLSGPRPAVVFHEVSTEVNAPRNNTPHLVESVQGSTLL